jgi:hypothetical protein
VLASFPKLPTCAACGLYSSACACSLCGGLELWMGLDGSRFCALIINHMYIIYIYILFLKLLYNTHIYICIHINIDIIVLHIRSYSIYIMHWMTMFVHIFSVQSQQRLKKFTVSAVSLQLARCGI